MKRNSFSLLALMALFCLTGCGGGNSTTSSSTSVSPTEPPKQYEVEISLDEYYDKTLGGLTAELWGNFSGLPTEFQFIENINPNYVEWKVGSSYVTDDDTSLEYVFTHTMETYGVNNVTYADIRTEWINHIRDYIWVGNENARRLMGEGYLPPDTGKAGINPCYRAIDAQIECGVFGMISPGMILNAKNRSDWWMRSVGDKEAVQCASFYSALIAELYVNNNLEDAIRTTMEYFEQNSSPYKIADYVLGLKETTPDWVQARQQVYQKYYLQNPIKPRDTLDSEINFAMVILSLIYGNSDFETTGQIALRAGFDNDCNAATACLMMGIAYGYEGLPENLKALSGDMYYNTNRPGLPDTTISEWSRRLVNLGIENALECESEITDTMYKVDDCDYLSNDYNSLNETRISASSDRWVSDGFSKVYNPEFSDGFGLASDVKDSTLEITVSGNFVTIYALTAVESGKFELFIDDKSYGEVDLNQSVTFTLGADINHIYNCLVKRAYYLPDGEHQVKIVNLTNETIEIDSIGFGEF